MSPLVLVGLGNPGRRYVGTRHNVGFTVLDALAGADSEHWRLHDAYYAHVEVTVAGRAVHLVKPLTYVNRSGEALRALHMLAPFTPEELLVIVDDIALPLGQLRLRPSGGDGGHNGLKSIIEALGSTDFPRLRVGVGPVPDGADPADFVLDVFEDAETPVIGEAVDRSLDCIKAVFRDGLDTAMNTYNRASGESG